MAKKNIQIDFSDKTILITGATSGIGRDLAIGFVEAGGNVIVHGRNESKTKELATSLNASFVLADLSQSSDVDRMISELCETHKAIHVLINNAGFEIRKPYEEFSMQEYDDIFNVNIRSIFQLTKGIFNLLKNASELCGEANVINMSSIHQKLPYPTNLPYSMSKAAMEMFGKIVGTEWAPYNIRVNTLAPGAIETEMNRDTLDELGRGMFSSWIGSGKIGTTQQVLDACFFLASTMSGYMTSETLYLDGALSKGLLPYGQTLAMKKMIQTLLQKDKK